MQRFGDESQNWYEQHVQIGQFEIKTEEVSVEWGVNGCTTCYSFKTEVYVQENTGDNSLLFLGLFVERPVVMARWPITGEGDICEQ